MHLQPTHGSFQLQLSYAVHPRPKEMHNKIIYGFQSNPVNPLTIHFIFKDFFIPDRFHQTSRKELDHISEWQK